MAINELFIALDSFILITRICVLIHREGINPKTYEIDLFFIDHDGVKAFACSLQSLMMQVFQ